MLKKMLSQDSDVVNYKLEKLTGPEGDGQTVLFGRGADVDYALDSKRCPLLISRKHASIKRIGNQLFLSDTKSTNGTYINDIRIVPDDARLIKDNDVISFGGASKVKQMNSQEEEFNPFLYKLKHTRRLFEMVPLNPTQLASIDHTGASPNLPVNISPSVSRPPTSSAEDGVIDLTGEPSARKPKRGQLRSAPASNVIDLVDERKNGGSLKRSNVVNLDSDSEGGLVVPPLRKSPARAPPAGPSASQSASKGDNPTLKALEAQFECQICREFLIAAHSLVPCGHMFCGECAAEWLDKKKTCPACRMDTTAAPVPLVKIDNIIEEVVVQHMNQDTKSERDRRKIMWARTKEQHNKRMEKIHKKANAATQNTISVPDLQGMFAGRVPPIFSLPFPAGQVDFAMVTGRHSREAPNQRMLNSGRTRNTMELPPRNSMRTMPSGQPMFEVVQSSGTSRRCNACHNTIQSHMPMIVGINGPGDRSHYHVGCEARTPGFLMTWRHMNGNIPGAQYLGPQNRMRIDNLVLNGARRR